VSPNFRDGGFLPVSAEFGRPGSKGPGRSGKNLAPTLIWYNVPAGTKSFVLAFSPPARNDVHRHLRWHNRQSRTSAPRHVQSTPTPGTGSSAGQND
jgi:hypothetical protein